MENVIIERIDEVNIKVTCSPSVSYELSDYFTFDVPGAKFSPAFRKKHWDGKIRLFQVKTGNIYSGLRLYIEEFCKSRKYNVIHKSDFSNKEFTIDDANDFIKKLNLKMTPRDYQINAFVHAVKENRALLLSPTASGKSFIIYLLVRYYAKRTLIIVPTTSLVSQLASDFNDYGFNSDKMVHRIYSGQDKRTDRPVTISTWQSIYQMDKKYFEQFEVIIGDEAHLFKAKSLTTIMTNLTDCKYRFGFTGTLDGSETNKLVLEGLFGPVRTVTTTSELIEQKHLSDFNIKCLVLSYNDEIRRMVSAMDYPAEMDFLVRLNARNKFIKNLVLSLEGNNLLLFQYVDKHGKELYNLIKNETDRPVYYIYGKVDGEEREEVRKIVENESNAIIVASYGTFSTGINIKKLHNIIFASPSKSRIRNLQSIGRVLRKSESKTVSTLYDISDDMKWKDEPNYTLLHFMERIKIYNEEKFNYKIFNINLKV